MKNKTVYKTLVRVLFIAVSCAAVLLPFAEKSEVIAFYGKFLPKSSVYVNAEGEYVYAASFGEQKLKFADRLEFSDRQAVEINIRGAEKSRLDYGITALTEPWVSVKDFCCLLKYIDGAWYVAEQFPCGWGGTGFVLNPNGSDNRRHDFGQPKNWWYILFFCGAWGLETPGMMEGKSVYTLPSGRYALFAPADKNVREDPDGAFVAEGLGLVEFDLVNLEGKPRRIEVELTNENYENWYDYLMTWGDYSVENVSETIYKDPYE